MNNFNLLDGSNLPAPTQTIGIDSTKVLDPTTLKTLDQFGSLTLLCITIWLCLYSTVQIFSNSVRLMEQINRFIELLVKKS